MRQLRLLSAVTALSLAIAACGGRKEPETLLGYVPADTPYVFANIDPVPKAYIDAMADKMAPIASLYEDMIKDALAKLAKEPADDPAIPVVKAILEELQGKISLAGMESIGLSSQAHIAMYGVGLVPVVRAELKDPAAFQAFIGRVEKRAGQPLLAFKVGDQSYWRIGKEGEEMAGLMAIAEGDLVLSLMPAKPSNELLERLLGVTLPEESLADEHKLQDLNKQYGFTPNGSGYIDMVRVMQSLVEEKTGIEKEFVAAIGSKDELPTPECKAELLGIAANMPRFAFGYTKLDEQQVDMLALLELKPELAKPLAAIPAPVPGLGAPTDSVFDFGFSLDVQKMVDFANAQAAAVAATPYKCADLADLNTGFAELRTSMANPGLMMAAPALKGARAVVTRFEMPAGGAIKGSFKGNLTVGDFASVDKLNAADFLKWKSLYFGGMDIRLSPMAVSIDDIALTDFYTRLILDAKGGLNIREITAQRAAQQKAAEDAAKTNGQAAAQPAPGVAVAKVAPPAEPPMPLSIKRITLQGGNIAYSDRFIKPNYDANLTGMGGRFVGLSSDPNTVAELDLRGKVDNAAPVEVVGKLNPFRQDRALDIKASVKDFELSSVSTYAAKYVGYGIEKGKLSAALNYKIEDRKLTATNQVFLDQLTFGDRVESPSALKLPVLLAVSRAIGETMIVVMAAGLSARLTANPLEAVTTVTVQIVTLLVGDQEFDSPKTLAAFALGLALFVVTLILNIVALRIVKKYREQYE